MERKQKPRVINQKRKAHSMDYALLLMIVLMCAFGLVMVYSASYYYALHYSGAGYDGFYYLRKQAIFMAIGFVAMLALAFFFNYWHLKKFTLLALLISVGLLVGVLAFGTTANGAKRWIYIGSVSLQPSEVAKFGMMIYMAAFMAKKQKVMKSFTKGMLPMLMVVGLVCVLILLQPNMSMAVIIGMMGYALLFLGGADFRQLLVLLAGCIVAFLLLAILSPYRLARMTTFTNPWNDGKNGLGSGYQLVQSLYALGSGGLFGQGLNGSQQKLLYMTYGESDFIFAILGEELGFVGVVVVMLCYAFIVWRGIRIALRTKDLFGKYLANGITIVFAIQVLVNIGVVSGSMPTTGQALPFISAGGTSLLLFMAAMGVLLNISRYTDDSIPLIKPRTAIKDAAESVKKMAKKRSSGQPQKPSEPEPVPTPAISAEEA